MAPTSAEWARRKSPYINVSFVTTSSKCQTPSYRLGNAKCKIFEEKQLFSPIDLSKILHLALPEWYISKKSLGCLYLEISESHFLNDASATHESEGVNSPIFQNLNKLLWMFLCKKFQIESLEVPKLGHIKLLPRVLGHWGFWII